MYANTYKSYLNELNILNNRILRIIQNKPLSTDVLELYSQYNTLPVDLLFINQISILTHNYMYSRDSVPIGITTLFDTNSILHTHYTRHANDLHAIGHSNNFGQRCVNYKFSKIWNDLPQDVKNIAPINIFKMEIKHYLLSRAEHPH